jgi:aryl-alcohol dehydrogenase-like predicted oxidoreductase
VEKVSLGRTDLRVTPLGIGAWAWGDRMTWGYGQGYGEADLREAFRVCLNAGIDFFDTAESYGGGQSEKFLGQFIREANRPVTLATKFMPYPWRWHESNLRESLRASLQRLGVERVDLYQIHWPFPPVPIETWMEAMADAVQTGLIRAVGVSNYSAEQMRRAHAALARRGIPLASNQVNYSLIHRDPERNGVMQTCRELGVTLIAYSPIGMGVLSGKYTPEHPLPMRRWVYIRPRLLQKVQPLVSLLREIGHAHGGKTPAQVALNWVMCKGALPIPGAKNARQAEENIGALGWRLTEMEVAALDEASW